MKVKYLVIAVVIVVLSGTGWYIYGISNAPEEKELVIKEIPVKEGNILIDFLADGSVNMDTYDLSFKSSGILSEILVNVGEPVEAGTVVAQLDPSEIEVKLRQNDIELQLLKDKSTSAVNAVYEDIQLQELSLSYLVDDLEIEKSTLSYMKTDLVSYTTNDFSVQEYKIVKLENQIAIEKLKLQALKSQSLINDELAIENILLNKELLKLDLANTQLVTPFNGVVVTLNGFIGEAIGTTSTFVTLQNQANPSIISMISEFDVHQVSEEQKVMVEFESEYGRVFEGQVKTISTVPSVDNNGIVSYKAEIELFEYPENIRAGLTTLLRFVLKERLDTLVIPNTAVSIMNNQQHVEIKTETGSEFRQIVTGLTDGTIVEVISGLNAGDIIITRTEK
jgi:multidrug resistance efflux pump